MEPASVCPECGATLPPNAPHGLCPRCLIHRGLEDETVSRIGPAPVDGGVLASLAATVGPIRRVLLRDTDLGRDLAIKVLLEAHRARPEMVRRFVEEAQIGGQLQHPGVVPVYDIGRFGGRPAPRRRRLPPAGPWPAPSP